MRLAWERLNLAVAMAVSPERAVKRAARLFATPPRFAHTAPERELLAGGAGFVVESSEGRIAAWRFGDAGDAGAPAVVLLHGWGGRGAQLRAFVPALVEAGYQAIVFDQAAHGFSEGREASLVHFMKGIVAVVGAVEADGTRIAGFVAHSLGAAAATAWLNRTRREMRVVLVAPPVSLQGYSGYFARRLGLTEPVRHAMQQRFEQRFGHRWNEFELPRSVDAMRAEALVIHDADDRDVAASGGLAIARAWPGARFVMTSGLGHRRILRDPSVVGDAVDFLADRVRFPLPPGGVEAGSWPAPSPIL